MEIIMLGHQKRQGKDTVAKILKDITGGEILRFADPMKNIVAQMLGVSYNTLDCMKNESPDYRRYLQVFGSGLMKDYFGKDVWRRLILQEIEQMQQSGVRTVIITDFRFPEEIIPEAITINVTGRVQSTDTHISETALNNFAYDHVIVNNGSLKELQKKVLALPIFKSVKAAA